LVFVALAVCAEDSGSQADTGGWTVLFDGESLSGWRGFKKATVPSGWSVENGTMSLVVPGSGDIMTEAVFSEFELSFEWRIAERGNSGVIYLVNETDDTEYAFETGPEYQVLDDDRHADGADADHRAGALYDLVPPAQAAARPVGEFNEARIVVQNGRIEHWLNGELIVESPFADEQWRSMVAASKFASMPGFGAFTRGHIAFQDHGDRVWYRNVKIKEL
jgi:hypothetical protein